MHVGIRIAQLLRERGWKQAELARRVGCSRATISHICRGGDPSLALLRRIAGELAVSESDLLEGTDTPARTQRSPEPVPVLGKAASSG